MKAAIWEYLGVVIKSWWAVVSVVAGVVGLASDLLGLGIPSGVWWAVVGVAVVLAQFTAFERVRNERNELRAHIEAEQAVPEAPTFVPSLFEGRLFPGATYSVIEGGSERAFVIRAALAFGTDADYRFDSETQKLFEDSVAGSAFEGWFQRQLDTIRGVPSEQFWERTQPTRSNIVTVARPAARIPHYDFTLAGHCVLNFHPGMGPWHAGYGELVASAILRSTAEATDFPGLPLSFDDLYIAIGVFEAALVDQIAPTVVTKITGKPLRPRSFAVLAIANGDSVANYVGLNIHRWQRASGSYDSNALWGAASSEETLLDPAARDREIKGWITRFLTDGGFSDFEVDVDCLQMPKLPEPLPT